MKIPLLTFANLVVAAALLLIPFLVSATSSASYDPWNDLDENGKIDIFDVVRIAGTYSTTGDATKNVTVTNWPKTTAITVFYDENLVDGSSAVSPFYGSDGFAHLHLLMHGNHLNVGEGITVEVYSRIWNVAHTNSYPIPYFAHTLTSASLTNATVLFVPSDNFYFRVDAATGTTASVCLSFYLS